MKIHFQVSQKNDEKPGAVAEVLDLTHDQHSPFRLEFDDHEWKEHINSLKPLGNQESFRHHIFLCVGN